MYLGMGLLVVAMPTSAALRQHTRYCTASATEHRANSAPIDQANIATNDPADRAQAPVTSARPGYGCGGLGGANDWSLKGDAVGT